MEFQSPNSGSPGHSLSGEKRKEREEELEEQIEYDVEIDGTTDSAIEALKVDNVELVISSVVSDKKPKTKSSADDG